MSKLFVTVLGTGNYFDCYYCKDDKSFRTPFIQEALMNFLYKNENKFEDFEMKILLTEKARDKNYYGENKLESILKKYDITPELAIIPEGKTSDELWDIFDKVSETIDESASKLSSSHESLDVNIDITHSLRNIPMQIVVAMNYLILFNNVNLEGIYYGAFELGETKIDDKFFENKSILDKLYNTENIDTTVLDKLKYANCCDDLDDEIKNEILSNSRNYKGVTISHAPICNLDTYYDLLKWTNAINSFIKCGNTKEIQQLSLIKKKQAFKSKNQEDIENMKLISYVVEALDKFTNCINTCRGMYGKKANNANNSISAASKSLSDALQNLNENITIKPLKKLFKLVENKIKPFENKDVLEIGIATVNWCIDYNLYQQGYTALDETIKTLICVKLNLPESKDKLEPENSYINREDIANAILSGFNKNTKDIRLSENLTEKDKVLIYDSINKLKEEKEFYKFIQSVKNYRNDINHFGFNSSGAGRFTAISDKLKYLRDKLVEYSKDEFPLSAIENPQSEVAADSSQI